MTFHSVLSIFLSSVATSLQHLRMVFSYHNWYVMPELAVTMQTFCTALYFLKLCFWNMFMLQQDWIITTEVLWSSSWTRWSLCCIHLHRENWFVQGVLVILSSFVYPGLDFLLATRRVFLEKLLGRLPYRCTLSMLPVFSGVRVAHLPFHYD